MGRTLGDTRLEIHNGLIEHVLFSSEGAVKLSQMLLQSNSCFARTNILKSFNECEIFVRNMSEMK